MRNFEDLQFNIFSESDMSFFLFSADDLLANFNALKEALDKYYPKYILSYSYKTNSVPAVLRTVKDLGVRAEVVSSDEFELAKKIGYRVSDIIYNGPIKTKDSFFEALDFGAIVNVDSKRELLWLSNYSKIHNNKQINIGIRLNFDLLNEYADSSTAKDRDPRFGFSDHSFELEELISYISSLGNVRINTLHLHHSNHSRSAEFYMYLIKAAASIAKKYKLKIEYLDIGGSFFAGGKFKDRFDEYIKNIALEIHKYDIFADISLILEPGASVVASAFSLYSIVIDKKMTASDYYLVTDASRCLIDPFMHKDKYDYRVIPGDIFAKGIEHEDEFSIIDKVNQIEASNIENILSSREQLATQYIAGYTCMENDILMRICDKPELEIGDIIIYDCVGSYTICFNPQFIRYTPEIYMLRDNRISKVRRKFNALDYLAQEIRE